MKTVIHQYNQGSNGAKALRQALGIKRIKLQTKLGRYPYRIINWGASELPEGNNWNPAEVINNPQHVKVATDKLLAFQSFERDGVSHVPFTTDRNQVNQWLEEGHVVFARTLTRGHSGKGIIELEKAEDGLHEIPNARLFTLYKKKKHEFRVHLVADKVIDIQQKKRQRNAEQEINQRVRSHANGWVFCREDLDLDVEHREKIGNLARLALASLNLDFGAVDIIYNKREDTFYVLEVNTAPGMEGTTLENYVNAFKESFLL